MGLTAFRQVAVRGNKRRDVGFSVEFQLKASKNVIIDEHAIRYDLDVAAYNDLVARSGARYCTQAILILMALPEDARDWLTLSEEQLVLKRCCYWTTVTGDLTGNEQTRRITIARSRLLTPEAVTALLFAVANGDPL